MHALRYLLVAVAGVGAVCSASRLVADTPLLDPWRTNAGFGYTGTGQSNGSGTGSVPMGDAGYGAGAGGGFGGGLCGTGLITPLGGGVGDLALGGGPYGTGGSGGGVPPMGGSLPFGGEDPAICVFPLQPFGPGGAGQGFGATGSGWGHSDQGGWGGLGAGNGSPMEQGTGFRWPNGNEFESGGCVYPLTPTQGLTSTPPWWTSEPMVFDNGELGFGKTDLSWTHDGTFICVYRTYRHRTENHHASDRDFGPGFNTNLRTFIATGENDNEISVYIGCGTGLLFTRPDGSSPFSPPPGFGNLELLDLGAAGFRLLTKEGYGCEFPPLNGRISNLASTRNRMGYGQDFHYDENGDLKRIDLGCYGTTERPCDERSIFIERDNGLITEIHDNFTDDRIEYRYQDGLLCGTIYYDDGCCLGEGSDPTWYVRDAEFDGRITGIQDRPNDPESICIYIDYDGFNNVVQLTDANGGASTFQTIPVAVDGTFIRSVTNAAGNRFEYLYQKNDDWLDLVGKRIINNPASPLDDLTIDIKFDGQRRVIGCELPTGLRTGYEFDDLNNPTRISISHDGTVINRLTMTYDGAYCQTVFDDLGRGCVFEYDSNKLLICELRDGFERNYGYNGKGLLTDITDCTGRQTHFGYNDRGHLTDIVCGYGPISLTTHIDVDGRGRPLSITRPLGDIRQFEYRFGRMVKSICPTDFSNESHIVTDYEYNRHGVLNQISISDPQAQQSLDWIFGRDANRNVTSVLSGGLQTQYGYDDSNRLVSITSPEGRTVNYLYDHLGRVTEVRENGVTVATYQRDVMGWITSETDGEGNTTTFNYDEYGRMISCINAHNDITEYDYDAAFRVTESRHHTWIDGLQIRTNRTKYSYDNLNRLTDVRGMINNQSYGTTSDNDARVQLFYDGEDRLTRQRLWTGAATYSDTEFVYDDLGHLISVTDPGGFETTYGHDDNGRRISVTNPLGHETLFGYDARGRLTTVTDAQGNLATLDYDYRDRLIHTLVGTTETALAESTLDYDVHGRITEKRQHFTPGDGHHASDLVSSFEYDDDGLLTRLIVPSGQEIDHQYDARGWLTRTLYADGATLEPEYDLAGRLVRVTRTEWAQGVPREFVMTYTRDGLGRAIATRDNGPDGIYGNSDDRTTSFEEQHVGYLQVAHIATDEAGRQSKSIFDTLGRLQSTIEDANTNGLARTTNYSYDRAGRLTSVTAYRDNEATFADQVTAYEYNSRGLKTRIDYPGAGHITLAYDSAGRLTSRTDERSIVTQFTWDNLNRLTSRASGLDVDAFDYDPLGRLTQAQHLIDSVNVALTQYTYDGLSRQTAEKQTLFSGDQQVVTRSFNLAGLASVGYPFDLGQIEYQRDLRDRVERISLGDGLSASPLVEYSWLGNAVHTRTMLLDYVPDPGIPGTPGPYHIKSDWERDGLLRTTSLSHRLWKSGDIAAVGELGAWSHTYDVVGNPLTQTQTEALGHLQVDRDFTYDSLNRLVAAQTADDSVGWSAIAASGNTWNQDHLGNRFSAVERDGTEQVYTHDVANRLTQVQPDSGAARTYDSDDAGNLTKSWSADGSKAYRFDYDHLNRLIEVREHAGDVLVARYTYDALSRRIEFHDAVNDVTKRYYYDGANEIVDTDESDQPLRHYVHGAGYVDERVAMFVDDDTDGTVTPYYYLTDRQYNVWALVDHTGSIVERYAYDPWGRPHIREAGGRGDFDNDGDVDAGDYALAVDIVGGTAEFDPRGDLDDDGDVDGEDLILLADRRDWFATGGPGGGPPSMARARSTVGNPYMFQGVPQFALDTPLQTDGQPTAVAVLILNQHRARFLDPAMGRWLTRDPAGYADGMSLYGFVGGMPTRFMDPTGRWGWDADLIEWGVFGLLGFHGSQAAGAAWNGAAQGAVAGGKAIGNATVDTAVSTVTIGFVQDVGLIPVNQIDINSGYEFSYGSARIGTEILAGVGTAGLSRTGSIVGTTVLSMDIASNVHGASDAVTDMVENGVGYCNSAELIASLAGLGANLVPKHVIIGPRRVAANTSRGMNNPKIRIAAARGRQAHREFTERVNRKPGWRAGRGTTIEGINGERLIPDAIDPKGRPVELKPNTPTGRVQGARQIQKYKDATGTNGRVIYYEP